MQIVTLLPTSGKLKQKISFHGPEWIVIEENKSTICLGGRPGFLIVPNDGGPLNYTHKQARWVLATDIVKK